MQASVSSRFGDWIQKGFDLYKNNFLVLVVASLLALLVSAFSFGLLAGPMITGLILIVLRLIDRDPQAPQIGDVFKGFSLFLPSFLFVLVWGVLLSIAFMVLNLIPCLGQLASIALSLAATALLMFALYFIADRKMDFWPASMASIERVKQDFWPFLGVAVVASILGSIGSVLCGVGVFLTLPLQFCIVGVAYREVFGGGGSDDGMVSVKAEPPPVA